MLTVGTDAKDVDWEAMWRAELDHDDRDPAEDGVVSAPCSHHYDSAGTLPIMILCEGVSRHALSIICLVTGRNMQC